MVRRPVGYSKWTCWQIVDWFCIRVCLILWKGCQIRLFWVLKLFSYSTIWLFILIASVIQLFAYFVMSYEAIWLFTYSAILQLTCEVVPPLLQNGFKMLETWMEQIGLKHCQKYPNGAQMYPKTNIMSPNASNISHNFRPTALRAIWPIVPPGGSILEPDSKWLKNRS